jgi:hypothetical protein
VQHRLVERLGDLFDKHHGHKHGHYSGGKWSVGTI